MISIENLIPVTNPYEFPLFFREDSKLCKVYNDGGHFIAVPIKHCGGYKPSERHSTDNKALKLLFDSLYLAARKEDLRGDDLAAYIKSGILKLFPDYPDIDGYIEKKIKRTRNNIHKRKNRFRRKANLNRWTHFMTITYDDKKHTPETFRTKLRKCFSNLHTRRGWLIMGKFEEAPDTGRLHFHGVVFIPDGEMIGSLSESKDYSKEKGAMQITHPNSFFAANFGRNDFEEIDEMLVKYGNAMKYILKYIDKTDERIFYSRGIPSEICMRIQDKDIATGMDDYCPKFILFDDVIDWGRHIKHYKPKQMTMIDLVCNPNFIA